MGAVITLDSVPPDFDYSNEPTRPPGRLVRVGSALLPGVRAVQRQVAPMAHAWERANRDAVGRTGPLWVALGDSMTQGIGTPGIEAGWVGQASRRLGSPYRIVNFSRSGATVADVITSQLPALRTLAEQPDLLTLLIGSNDLMGQERSVLPERFAELLDQLPRGTVVANLPNPTRTATAVNALLVRAAAGGAIVIADLTSSRPPSWRGRLAEDHFHPNAAGYASLADAFVEAIAHARTEPGLG